MNTHLLTTDIMGNSEGSGVLTNLDGKIVGVIAQSFSGEADTGGGDGIINLGISGN